MNMFVSQNWTTERMVRLEELYRDGVSFGLIARDIGVTRSAAIGKARRMQLPKRIEINVRQARPRTIARAKRRHRVAGLNRQEIEDVPDVSYRCTIYELIDASCRYPLWAVGDPHHTRFYCGRPEAKLSSDIPYCRRHARLCEPRS
jgi:hypothetical protein